MGKSKFSSREYTRGYSDFRGVDMCGKSGRISRDRMAACINMYKDYQAEGAPVIESVPGYRRIAELGAPIRALYKQPTPYGDGLLIHAGQSLYRLWPSDTEPVLLAEGMAERGTGFCHGGSYYVLSAGDLIRVGEDGVARRLGREELVPYEPTTYINGQAYEQRNLLTDCFNEITRISEYEQYAYGTPGLKYEITDPDLALCRMESAPKDLSGAVFIPGRVRIGNTVFRVEEISDNAFAYNSSITEVHIGEGVKRIGKFAFRYCNYITKITTPRSLTQIDNAAFMDCARLTDLYLSAGLEEVGHSVFSACISLESVNYEGDEESLGEIINSDTIQNYTVNYGVTDRACVAEIPLFSPVNEIDRVTVGEQEWDFDLIWRDGRPSVTLRLSSPSEITGAEICVHGSASQSPVAQGQYSDFLSTEEGRRVGGRQAVLGCMITECFDGRVFYSGNPDLPNTVFFSTRRSDGQTDPLYIGGYCYFNDGIGSHPVISMLSVRDSLTVFKAGDDGTGSIFYHTVQTTGDDIMPTVYPVSYVHSGLCAKGSSLNFLDDPVFLSPSGLSAICRTAINYERSIATRSHNVNYELLREDMSRASLTEWAGYLVVGCGPRVYLADSRATFNHHTGSTEYEWFYMCGLGEWRGDTKVYRYASSANGGLRVHPYPDTVCSEEVYSYQTEDGLCYYCKIDGVDYALYLTEERVGGEFCPATVYLGIGDLLYFGTEGGAVMLFNNDKRGVAPQRIASRADFDPEDYAQRMGRQIHPDFYAFDGHAARYAITTPMDDCDIPNMTKATVKRSTVLRCKAFTSASLTVDVSTDLSGYSELTEFSPGELNFHELDFSRMSLTSGEFISVPINERERGWIEKQYTLYSDAYCCPIGICSLTYRYTLHGNVKQR